MPVYEKFVVPATKSECLDYLDIHLGQLLASWFHLDLGVLQQMTKQLHAREVSGGDWTPSGGDDSLSPKYFKIKK